MHWPRVFYYQLFHIKYQTLKARILIERRQELNKFKELLFVCSDFDDVLFCVVISCNLTIILFIEYCLSWLSSNLLFTIIRTTAFFVAFLLSFSFVHVFVCSV